MVYIKHNYTFYTKDLIWKSNTVACCWTNVSNILNNTINQWCLAVHFREGLAEVLFLCSPVTNHVSSVCLKIETRWKNIVFNSAGRGGGSSEPFFHCPSCQGFSFTVGQPPLPPHQRKGTTLLWDGVPPTKPYNIDPRHHPGLLMEVLGIQTLPLLWHRRQVARHSSLEAAGLPDLLFSPRGRPFRNIAGRCVQMSTF